MTRHSTPPRPARVDVGSHGPDPKGRPGPFLFGSADFPEVVAAGILRDHGHVVTVARQGHARCGRAQHDDALWIETRGEAGSLADPMENSERPWFERLARATTIDDQVYLAGTHGVPLARALDAVGLPLARRTEEQLPVRECVNCHRETTWMDLCELCDPDHPRGRLGLDTPDRDPRALAELDQEPLEVVTGW